MLPLGTITGLLSILTVIFSPPCQMINRGVMENTQQAEEIYRILVEKCDLYDNIDAILSLKSKYSLYELEQITKERKLMKNKIIVDNMINYSNKRKGNTDKI